MIAITGVNGFVGGSLYRELGKKYECVGISTHPARKDVVLLQDGIPGVMKKPPEVLIHCGGIISGQYTMDDYEYANVYCTNNLLKWAQDIGVRQFIFFSTGAVYGENEGWCQENDALRPLGGYAMSKAQAESLVRDADIPQKVIFRLYFPIGKLKYNHLFSRLSKKILSNDTVCLNFKGKPFITPISIDDVITCIERAMHYKLSDTYNLSSNRKINLQEIVELLIRQYRSQSSIKFTEKKVENYMGCSKKLQSSISFDAFMNIDLAIEKMLKGSLLG